ADGRAAAAEDGDVESVDARGEQDLGGLSVSGRRGEGERRGSGHRFRLSDETLQRPRAAALDLCGDAGERYEGSECGPAALERERGHVVLDAVVVCREGRRARDLDRSVRADEPGTGERGGGVREDRGEGEG